MTSSLPIAALTIQLCTTQATMDRVAVLADLPSGSPPLVLQVGPELEWGWITGLQGRYWGRRSEWYIHDPRTGEGTVFVVRGQERMCIHGIVHRLQALAEIEMYSWKSELQARLIQMSYRRMWPYR